jgi:hypothetical protein
MSYTRALSYIALFAVLCSGAVPARAQNGSPITVLAACGGKPEVRPTRVLFACGDGGVWADSVRWTQWGEQVAMATATMHANDCTPNCADGHMHAYAAVLIVAGRQALANGQFAYQRIGFVKAVNGLPADGETMDWRRP